MFLMGFPTFPWQHLMVAITHPHPKACVLSPHSATKTAMKTRPKASRQQGPSLPSLSPDVVNLFSMFLFVFVDFLKSLKMTWQQRDSDGSHMNIANSPKLSIKTSSVSKLADPFYAMVFALEVTES